MLLYNAQATSPVTQHVQDLARAAGIPVVAVTETQPPNEPSYQALAGAPAPGAAARAREADDGASSGLRDASMRFGARALFEHLDLDIEPGEFLAVLGPNGAGKTTLLRILLGLTRLSGGDGRDRRPRAEAGEPRRRLRARSSAPSTATCRSAAATSCGSGSTVTGRGLPFGNARSRARVDAAIRSVGAERYADAPIGLLSGGEQQRLRIAQALIGDPKVLLCDEPLAVARPLAPAGGERADRRPAPRRRIPRWCSSRTRSIRSCRTSTGCSTSSAGVGRSGTPDEVLTSEGLSDLYGTDVDVLQRAGPHHRRRLRRDARRPSPAGITTTITTIRSHDHGRGHMMTAPRSTSPSRSRSTR